MHPAPSVIIFTTLSGLGFGLLAWLGVAMQAPTGWSAFWIFALGFGLSVGGLAASTFHLGRPDRAWRAFSQWKTSWLSREGICAVAALIILGLYAFALIFFGRHYAALGWIGALLSLGTVFTTSMIYSQLTTVPRWNTPLTSVLFLSLSITGGALLAGKGDIVVMLLLLVGIVQVLWWAQGDKAFAGRDTDLGTATGLGDLGAVRSMAHPHSSPNYLMKEFMHVVGRKHAMKLRVIAMILMCIIPVLLLVVFPFNILTVFVSLLSHIAGVAISRWLFFAQAEHVVGLYYGMR